MTGLLDWSVNNRKLVTTVAVLLACYALFKIAQYLIIDRFTAVYDTSPERLGAPRRKAKLKGQAVVCGGSFTGLLSASILSKHYEKVIVIESEYIAPNQTEPRKNVLQYLQLHTFLAVVTRTLTSIFPDFKDQVRAYGGRVGDFIFPFYLSDMLRLDPETYAIETLYISRHGMETILRRLVTERCPNVEIRYKASVVAFEGDKSSDRVTAVQVRVGDSIDRIPCALVLDATGPALGSLRWLPKIGYEAPKKLSYDPGVYYATAVFDLSKLANREELDPDVGPKDGYILGCRPACGVSRASGFWSRIENEKLLVTANMWNGDEGLPRELKDFPAYFEAMPHYPEHIRLLKALVETQPDTPVWVARPPACHRVEWDKVKTPSNFIPVGDTMHKLNAQYGQGTAQASVCVATLNRLLNGEKNAVSSGFSKRYIDMTYGRTTYMWDSSRLTDYGWSNTRPAPGETLQDGAGNRWVQEIVIQAMACDPEVTRHVYDGSAQGMKHHLLELLNLRLIYWLLRLSIFGMPKKIPAYRKPPRAELKA